MVLSCLIRDDTVDISGTAYQLVTHLGRLRLCRAESNVTLDGDPQLVQHYTRVNWNGANISHIVRYKEGIDRASKLIQVIDPSDIIDVRDSIAQADKVCLSVEECIHGVCSDIGKLRREVGATRPRRPHWDKDLQ